MLLVADPHIYIVVTWPLILWEEAIAHGRAWVEARVDLAPAIASNMMKRVVFLSSSLHRLHVLYLLHDIFIHEAQRLDTLRPLTSAFKPCLVWMVRPTYQIAQSVRDA